MNRRLVIIAALACTIFAIGAYAQTPWVNCGSNTAQCTSGNVGIGGANPPTGALDVLQGSQDSYLRSNNGNGYSRVFVNNNAGGGFYMLAYGSTFPGTSTFGGLPNANLTLLLGTGAGGLVVGTSQSQPIVFSTFGGDRMRI